MTPEEVSAFWQQAGEGRWFFKDAAFDGALKVRFGDALAQARNGAFDHWAATPEGALGLVILLDQMSRNIHRGTPQAFAYDAAALELALFADAAGYPDALHPLAGAFFNLPFEHAEDVGLQRRSVAGYARQQSRAEPDFADLLDEWVVAGRDHLEVIERFGRFPHRNAILGRASTPEELAWLADGGRHWGQVAAVTPP